MNVIEKKWKEYTTTISSQGHASSLELCQYLFKHLKTYTPEHVVDMGSGFSSFVTRYYKKEINPNAIVYSVDDDVTWLEKTKQYLIREELPIDNLVLFEDFKNTDLKFDLILYDLGRIPTRIKNIEFPATITKSGATILYDDIHFDKAYSNKCRIYDTPYLQDVFFDYTKKNGLSWDKLIETYDIYGRYCMKVIMP